MFWYQEELDRLTKEKNDCNHTPETVFYGSSSFRLWNEIESLYQEYKPINLGFGGSTLAACSWFFKKNFEGLNPKSIVFYAGDNDLGDGRHPEEVVLFFKTLVSQIRESYGNIPVTFVSIKPSPNRWYLEGSIKYTNRNIKEYTETEENLYFVNIFDSMLDSSGKPNQNLFIEDGLHMNSSGYKIWFDKIISNRASFVRP